MPLNTLRLLSRTAINPSGVNLGDSYLVLYEQATALASLPQQLIGIPTACRLELDCCVDLIMELELCTCGGKIQRRGYVSTITDRVIVFTVTE